MEVKNRRENVLIDGHPPKVLTPSNISKEGFVKNTDYATVSKGGVLKIDSTLGVKVVSGKLSGNTRTPEMIGTDPEETIICKGTLVNLLPMIIDAVLISSFENSVHPPDTSLSYIPTVTYVGDKWVVEWVSE